MRPPGSVARVGIPWVGIAGAGMIVAAMFSLTPLFASKALAEGPRRGMLTRIKGDTIEGSVAEIDSNQMIGWQGSQFLDPFRFRLGSVRSIKYPAIRSQDGPIGPFSFELTNGDLIGDLVGLTAERVVIDADTVGRVELRRGLLRHIHRISDNDAVTFSSLRGMEGWSSLGGRGESWSEDGDQIWTSDRGAAVLAPLSLPRRAVIDIELSWGNSPDFVVALGVDPNSQGLSQTDGWRLETADDGLTIVREESDRADVARLVDLSRVGRIRLILYLDQQEGQLHVLRSDGKTIGAIALPPSDEPPSDEQRATSKSTSTGDANRGGQSGIRIVNRGDSLRLERLQVSKWVGGIPQGDLRGQASIAMADGSVVSGRVTYDGATDALQLQGSAVNLSQVMAVRLNPQIGMTDPGPCALFLRGGMRLSGELVAVDQRGWTLGGENYVGQVLLPHEVVRSVVVFDSDAADRAVKPVLGRVGRLEIDRDRSAGRLIDGDAGGGPKAFALRWQPLTSASSARIRASALGRVVYREPPKTDSESAAARMLAQQRLRNRQQRRGLNFGQLFLERADLTRSGPVKRDAHVIHFRSGDVIACRVESIEEGGVMLSTAKTDRGFVPHDEIKAIEFVSNSPPPDIDKAKRERLLTVPRLQKKSPPSHLLCSHNGDFLRCRLMGTRDESFQVEIQSDLFPIPRDRIAQIIWFHSDEIPAETGIISGKATNNASVMVEPEMPGHQTADQYEGLAQVVLRDGKRVTFAPTAVQEGSILGTSRWVGPCEFDLDDVDQLLLGNQIAIDVADISYNQWKLRPAVEPLVTAEMQAEGEPASPQKSPLVGTEAPPFRLGLLDGGSFDLSESRGQTVVLAFWASWSAPSMRTMPMVAKTVAQFDPSLVRLVSINLQESAEQVRSALERIELGTDVVLDLDGATAREYETSVIPQLVVVGPDGKIQGVLVGGGADSVEALAERIREILQR